MRRGLVLGALIGVGALSLVVSGQAQGPSADAIKAAQIEKVKDNLYIITGSGADNQATFSGGNVAVFITDAGVTLVDTKLPGFGPTILERIKTVTNKPVTRIINTHTHGDHTGSNAAFGASVETHRAREHQGEHGEDARVQRGQRQVRAEADLQGQADRRIRQRSDRPLSLRSWAHERRHLRRLHRAADDARG